MARKLKKVLYTKRLAHTDALRPAPVARPASVAHNTLLRGFLRQGIHEQTHTRTQCRILEHQDGQLIGAGHRVVHGGEHFCEPLLIDAKALAALERLVPLAPLHQPHNLAAIRALMVLQPSLPQVACFDTAFHRTQDALAQNFALPRELTAGSIKRYGFHGLSFEHIASVLPQYLGPRADGRVIVAHLGNGASLCALRHRKSFATTMGFTALDGLMVGTRCGAIDPGVILYLMREKRLSPEQIEDRLLERNVVIHFVKTAALLRSRAIFTGGGATPSVSRSGFAPHVFRTATAA